MGIVFRQSIKATLVIFTGVVLGAVIAYLSTVIVPIHDLGGSRIMLAQGAVFQLAFLVGTGSLLQTFSQRYNSDDPRKPVLITFSLLTPLIAAAIFSIPYFLCKDFLISRYQVADRPFLAQYYSWILLLSILLSYMTQMEHYLASQYKVAASIFMREIVLRICIIALLVGFYFGWLAFPQFIIGMVLVHMIPLACLLLLSSRTNGFFTSTRWSVFTRKEYREMIHYSWYHMLTGVSLNVLSFVDVLLLGPLSSAGFSDVAIYTNAQFFIAILTVPYRAMASAAFPALNAAFINDDHPLLKDLFNRASLNMLIVALAMWLLVCCNLHNAVAVFPPSYAPLLPVVLILSLGRIVDMMTGLNTELISVTSYYKFNFRMSIILLAAVIVLDRVFIPRSGIYGAAWVSCVTLIFFNIIKMIFLYRKTGLQPFSRSSLRLLLPTIFGLIVGFGFPTIRNPFADTLLRSIATLSAYGSLILLLRPSPDLHDYLQQVRKDKRLF